VDIGGRTLLGKYRIEGLLGQGGMGSVWKGTHVVTGRKVAIKVLDERFLSNASVVQRFGREARAASAIQHHGIVEVLDLDQTEEGLPFLVMEFLDGETLSQRIDKKGRLSQEETTRIGVMLLDALEAAHQHGVVHRDLKPDNIFLVPAGRKGEVLKVIDFGISHKDDEAQAKLTMTGSVLGTPHYMSPEQAMGETNLDRRVDIYGVGIVLYECLVGDVPFDAPNYNKLLRVILDNDPVPPSQRGAAVDARLERLIMSAIAKDRAERPQTARQMLDRMTSPSSADDREPRSPLGSGSTPRSGDPSRSSASKRSASATFARPQDPSSVSSGAIAIPPISSEVRARSGASQQIPLAAAGGSARGVQAATLPEREAPPPAARAGPGPGQAPTVRLDPSARSGSFALDDFDAAASGSSSLELELDESALARPRDSFGHPSSSSSSGQHRAIGDRSASPDRSPSYGALRAQPSRSTPGSTRPPPQQSGRVITPVPVGGRHSDPAPAVPAGPPSLRDRWERLSDGARRAISLGVGGLAIFVAIVVAVRYVVRPGEEDALVGSRPDPTASAPRDHEPAAADWVLVDVDGVPGGAQLRLDGLPGATLPLRVRRGRHVLEIHAPGYQDRRIEFSARESTRIRADMRPAIGTTTGGAP
jgi:serine/threonine protein kinase